MTYRVDPPTEYVSNLRVGSINGFFGGEPGGPLSYRFNGLAIRARSALRDVDGPQAIIAEKTSLRSLATVQPNRIIP